MTAFISSNANDDTPWHIAVRSEARSPSGKLFGVYFKTRCSGRQLGGAYGQTKRDDLPEHARLCARCAALGEKAAAYRNW